MDDSKFSSSNSDGYAIDADFLIGLTDRLVEIATRHGATELIIRAVASSSIGAHGRTTIEYAGARAAIAALVGLPESFEYSIQGQSPGGSAHDRIMISMDLRPSSSDFLYAKGPVAMAHEAHETMRAAMAAQKEIGVRAQAEAVRRASVEHPAIARRVATGDRLRNALDSLRWIVPVAGYLVLLAAAIRLPKGAHAAMAFAGTFACIGIGLLLSSGLGGVRKARRERLRARAAEIGLTIGDDDRRPIRRFDFGRPIDTDAARLGYAPLEPLRV